MLNNYTSRSRFALSLVLALFWFSRPVSLQAILFYSTAAPDFNTTGPTGALAGSGWQYQGNWGAFLGTPIAPHYFITAKHVGGRIGDLFVLNGQNYTSTASYGDPNSDLIIWRVRETFPSFAPLYTNNDEIGKTVVVFGRGTQRGAEVTVTNRASPQLKGWLWGTPDYVKRWGQNQVDTTVDGGPGVGYLLRLLFKADGGINEADISGGDSGGAVFIQDGPLWKLAGLNNAVEGPFNTTNSGPGFEAAIFDLGGLFAIVDEQWTFFTPSTTNQPTAFYATPISSHLAWIQAILASANGPLLLSAPSASGPYQVETSAILNASIQTLTVAKPNAPRFYQLQDLTARRILGLQLIGDNLVITYEEPR